ncbi:hypothetical protein [Verminephrobacter aporrectodeae]|nr:hypothetical protein [Verminephrobacter aporrectodeae]
MVNEGGRLRLDFSITDGQAKGSITGQAPDVSARRDLMALRPACRDPSR